MTLDALEERLRRAYGTAVYEQQRSARVEIHFGSAVLEEMRARAEAAGWDAIQGQRAWGFPIVERPCPTPPDHISVHSVHTIA